MRRLGDKVNKRSINTPLGVLVAIEKEGKLVELSFSSIETYKDKSPLLLKLEEELEEYFNKKRRTFTIPLNPEGTAFQKKVWKTLEGISYGETLSYSGVAKIVGSPKGMRAAGGACGKNPILILIPCHRVLAKDKTLGGFSAGIERKVWLLDHEEILFNK